MAPSAQRPVGGGTSPERRGREEALGRSARQERDREQHGAVLHASGCSTAPLPRTRPGRRGLQRRGLFPVAVATLLAFLTLSVGASGHGLHGEELRDYKVAAAASVHGSDGDDGSGSSVAPPPATASVNPVGGVVLGAEQESNRLVRMMEADGGADGIGSGTPANSILSAADRGAVTSAANLLAAAGRPRSKQPPPPGAPKPPSARDYVGAANMQLGHIMDKLANLTTTLAVGGGGAADGVWVGGAVANGGRIVRVRLPDDVSLFILRAHFPPPYPPPPVALHRNAAMCAPPSLFLIRSQTAQCTHVLPEAPPSLLDVLNRS